ncbi:MAG TPA: hypothetical protein VMY39_09100, partial [Planctomycetota bacterium]|nr:hypothetical protein [Planctomycetota bacterium]
MKTIGIALLVAGLCLAGAVPARALGPVGPVTYDAQSRLVSAAASGDGSDLSSDSTAAADFGPFAESVYASSAGTFGGYAEASGAETSTLGLASISASGSAYAYLSPPLTGEGLAGFSLPISIGGGATGTSLFSTTFTLSQPVTYTLTGSLDASSTYGGGYSLAVVSLTGDGTTILSYTFSAGSNPLNETGVLGPGQYTLSASALASVGYLVGDEGPVGS